MDFGWSNSQDEYYRGVFDFARFELDGRKRERALTRAEWLRCGEMGLLGLCVPADFGGLGLDALTTARMMEALGRGCSDLGVAFGVAAHLFATVMPIVEFGSEAIKRLLLPKLCAGSVVGCNAITEANAGSDVFSLRAKAVRGDDGDYRLTGTKTYATNAPVADVFVVYASTNPAHGFLGISGFVVERGAAGVTVGEPLATMGLHSAPAAAVYLDDVRVPESNRLGLEGQGGKAFQSSMQWERSCLFGAYVGMMDRQLEQTIAYANDRRQFGRRIGGNQAVSHQIVNMKLRLESARNALYRACSLRDQGRAAVAEVSMAKLLISEAARQSSIDAIQIHGATGYARELGLEQALRDSIPSTIFSGTSEMQRDIIAQELGLR